MDTAFMASRRSMLAGTFGAISATMLSTALVAANAPAKCLFADRLATYQTLCAEYDALDHNQVSDSETNAAFSRLMAAYDRMLETPAPDAAAVASKLDAILHEMRFADIDADHLAPIVADLRRLAALP